MMSEHCPRFAPGRVATSDQ